MSTQSFVEARSLSWSVCLLPLWVVATACGDDTTEPVTRELEVSITTTGRDFDPDGYAVTVDAGNSQPVPLNGTLSIPGLSAGEHTVILTGLATNCTAASPASLQVQIPEQGTAHFEVTCAQIYTLAYEGAAGVELTNAAGTVHRTLVTDAKPLGWSPDGELLAVVQRQDPSGLWLISPDSGDLRELTRSPTVEGILTAKWAPDGLELLYEDNNGPNSFPMYLNRVALDGSFDSSMNFVTSGVDACADNVQAGAAPDWSPDGRQVVVHHPNYWPTHGVDLYILSRDGSGQRLLVPGQQPDWSPDGSVIAFVAGRSQCDVAYVMDPVRHDSSSLHLIGPDGNSERQLTHPSTYQADENPVWSPDGSTLAFMRLSVGADRRVTSVAGYLVDADGTNARQLAVLPLPDPIVVYRPSWSADGRHLAFAGPAGTYVVGADGSGFHTVSDAVTALVPAQWRP